MIYLYRFIWIILSPIVDIWFIWRLIAGKEDKGRLKERLGISSVARPHGPLVWFHGASVGETLSILPLIDKLLAENESLNILVTSGTVTSAKLMKEKLPQRAIHQYVPLDFYSTVMSFMEFWRPDLSVFVESEFWPELLHQSPNKVLINARMSDRSYRRYSRYKWFIQELLKGFKLCLTQSPQDETRFKALGIQNVEMGGNLKFDIPDPEVDKNDLAPFMKELAKRPLLVVASTHDPEESWLAALHLKLKEDLPDLLTIVAPRHPNRGDDVSKLLSGLGETAQRSKGEMFTKDTDFYVADTIGEMALWYTLAAQNGVVFMGGSLIPHGGQNPLEALKVNAPVICGPHMHNFRNMMEHLLENGAIGQAGDIGTLCTMIHTILTNKKHRATALKPVKEAIAELSGSTDYTATKLHQLLGGVR